MRYGYWTSIAGSQHLQQIVADWDNSLHHIMTIGDYADYLGVISRTQLAQYINSNREKRKLLLGASAYKLIPPEDAQAFSKFIAENITHEDTNVATLLPHFQCGFPNLTVSQFKRQYQYFFRDNIYAMRFSSGKIMRYLYLQILHEDKACTTIDHEGTKGHPLAAHQAVKLKSGFKSQLSAASYVRRQINVALCTTVVYFATDLQRIPHGDEHLMRKLASDRELIDKYGVEIVDVSSDTLAFEEENVKVYRPGSVIVDKLDGLGLGAWFRTSIFNYTWEHGSTVGKFDKKDIRDLGTGRRYDLGFTQGQKSSKLIHNDEDFKIPKTHVKGDKYLANMPSHLKHYLGVMLKYFQSELKERYPDAMCDEYRTKLARPHFMNRFFPGMDIDWEYFNISVRKSTDVLLKHMDHMNDSRDGYNYSCVHSFLFPMNGEEYRFTIVMTFRRSWGKFMFRLRAKYGDN